METLVGFGDFTMEGQVKYTDGSLLLARKKTMLQGVTEY